MSTEHQGNDEQTLPPSEIHEWYRPAPGERSVWLHRTEPAAQPDPGERNDDINSWWEFYRDIMTGTFSGGAPGRPNT